MKNNFSTPAFLWPLLTLFCLMLIIYGLHKTLGKTCWPHKRRRTIMLITSITIIAWTGLITILAYKGFFANFTKLPPRPILALLVPLPFILAFAFSKTGTGILRSVPPHWLVSIQSFRIVVELLLWFAFLAGTLPVQMSFEGGNPDVLTGLLALPAAYILAVMKPYSYTAGIAFNITGLLLLLNILIIAALSMPTPFRYFMNEPSNAIVSQFPYILLPGVLVPVAYGLHILSLRQIYLIKKARTTTGLIADTRLIFEANILDREEKNNGHTGQHKSQFGESQTDKSYSGPYH